MKAASESLADRVAAAVLGPAGRTDRALRSSALERAASAARGEPPSDLAGGDAQADALAAFVDKVARHAYRTTDDEVARLLAAGYTEDALFDVIVAAAVGSGLARRELGLAAVAAWERESAAERRAGA